MSSVVNIRIARRNIRQRLTIIENHCGCLPDAWNDGTLLEDEGYVVHTAANGRDAVEMLTSDGWQLMAHVRRHPELSTIPIGIQTGDTESTLPDGVAFVLSKPVDVEALIAVVRHHCG